MPIEVCSEITEIIHELNSGKVIAFPTETVYHFGVGLKKTEEIKEESKGEAKTDAIEDYADEIKQRLIKMYNTKVKTYRIGETCPVLMISGMDMLCKYTNFDTLNHLDYQYKVINLLIKRYTRYPVTLILTINSDYTDILPNRGGKIAVHLPSHPKIKEVLEEYGYPILATSANYTGQFPAIYDNHVTNNYKYSDREIVLIPDKPYENNIQTSNIESTIVEISDYDHLQIHRQGIITSYDIKQLLINNYITIDVQTLNYKIKPQNRDINSNNAHNAHNAHIFNGSTLEIPIYLVSMDQEIVPFNEYKNVDLSKSILLDFGNLFGEYQTKVAKYYDMSPNMDSDILRLDLFKRLYYIINSLDDDIKSILICDFSSIISQNNKYGSSLYSIYDNIYKIVDGFAKLD
jgi:tRNA A37 threonylcarbamoyladenosine synthetase subunit TsaC/SUA5/YrdC